MRQNAETKQTPAARHAPIEPIAFPWYVQIPPAAIENILTTLEGDHGLREGHMAYFRARRNAGMAIFACINSEEELAAFRATADKLCRSEIRRINASGMAMQRALRTPQAGIYDHEAERMRGLKVEVKKPLPDDASAQS